MRNTVTEIDLEIAKRLKVLRKDRKVTQRRMADFLGIAYQSYQKMEAGKVSFRASTVAKLAQILGVSTLHFFDGYAASFNNGVEIAYVVGILNELSKPDAGEIVRFATSIKANRG